MTSVMTGPAFTREKPRFLKYYTHRPRLESILEGGVLRLADPAVWPDKND